MNIRNVISVPDESVQDDFVKYVISNCTTKIILSGRREYNFSRQEYNFQLPECLAQGKHVFCLN